MGSSNKQRPRENKGPFRISRPNLRRRRLNKALMLGLQVFSYLPSFRDSIFFSFSKSF